MCAPAAQHASSKPRSELPTRPTAAGIVRRIPAVDLWTTRQSMNQSAKKCYPCCRMLRTKPVFTQGVESEEQVMPIFCGLLNTLLAVLRMGCQPDLLEARGAHRVERIVMHPRLKNHVRHRMMKKDPRRIGDHEFFGLAIIIVALLEVTHRRRLREQRIQARVEIESIVVGAPLFT